MKNSFNLEINFSKSPRQTYEWPKACTTIHVKATRVSTRVLHDVLMYDGKIVGENGTLLLSDTVNAAAIRLDKEGNIVARSFLKFDDELDVAEFSANLKETSLEVVLAGEKIHYDRELSIETEMKKYLIERIENCPDEDLSKYLYYLYFDEVSDYSREKLLSSIEKSSIDRNMKLYNFLIET